MDETQRSSSPSDRETVKKNGSEEASPDTSAGHDAVRRLTRIVLIAGLIIFIWYLFADRYAPYTDMARVKTVVIPLVPRVSGYVTEIHVELHQPVQRGQLLFRIDPKPYQLAVKKAEAHLDEVAQQVGAMTASVKAAAARLGVARAQLDRAQRNYDRTQKILKQNPGALSRADLDLAETSLAQALERVASAEADLEKAKQKLGTSGENNAQLRVAMAQLEQAQLELAFTEIRAPGDGVIENLDFDTGFYAQAGKPLAALINPHRAWIEAYLRENSLAHIDPGEKTEFVLDVAPGRVHRGTVHSVGYGVSVGGGGNRGELPGVPTDKGWLRDPQRFPVIILPDDPEAIRQYLRSGGQADVIIYASRNPILNLIGWLQIRISSWLSYVR